MKVTLQRVFVEKRAAVLAVSVLVVANVLFYALAVYPLSVKVQNDRARAEAAGHALGAAQRDHTSANATLAGKDRARQELRRFYEDVLPADVAGARRITYLRLAQLAGKSNLKAENRNMSLDPDPDSRLGRLRVSMVLQGGYENVRKFIYQLETAPEFVVIEDVALAQGGEPGSPLTFTLALSTYYRATPPAPAGGNGS